VFVDAGPSSRHGPARWTVEVSETDHRSLTLDEVVTCWLGGLVRGDALAGREGQPWRWKIRDLPEVRSRLGVFGTEPRRAAQREAETPGGPYLPGTDRTGAGQLTVNELSAFAHGVDAALAPNWERPADEPLADSSSARTIVEAVTRYAERNAAPDSRRIETLAPASLPSVARDATDSPRSSNGLVYAGLVAMAATGVLFLWRATRDTPSESAAAARPEASLAQSAVPIEPVASSSASAPASAASAASSHGDAPIGRSARRPRH
jgi:hypothetical protein